MPRRHLFVRARLGAYPRRGGAGGRRRGSASVSPFWFLSAAAPASPVDRGRGGNRTRHCGRVSKSNVAQLPSPAVTTSTRWATLLSRPPPHPGARMAGCPCDECRPCRSSPACTRPCRQPSGSPRLPPARIDRTAADPTPRRFRPPANERPPCAHTRRTPPGGGSQAARAHRPWNDKKKQRTLAALAPPPDAPPARCPPPPPPPSDPPSSSAASPSSRPPRLTTPTSWSPPAPACPTTR